MKFQITCKYQVTANNYTTCHEAKDTVEAISAVQACNKFLDDLASSFGDVITKLEVSVSIEIERKTIHQMIDEYIQESGMARLVNDGMAVVFLDENETIPMNDLGYNHEYGFYSISQFPDIKNEADG